MKQWIPFGRDGASDSKRLWASVVIVAVVVLGVSAIGIVAADGGITEIFHTTGSTTDASEIGTMGANDQYIVYSGGEGSDTTTTVTIRHRDNQTVAWQTSIGGYVQAMAFSDSDPSHVFIASTANNGPKIALLDIDQQTVVTSAKAGYGDLSSSGGVDASPDGEYAAMHVSDTGGPNNEGLIVFFDATSNDLSIQDKVYNGNLGVEDDASGKVATTNDYTYVVNEYNNISVYDPQTQSYVRTLHVGGDAETVTRLNNTVAVESGGTVYTLKNGIISDNVASPVGGQSAAPVLDGNGIAIYNVSAMTVIDQQGTVVNSTSISSDPVDAVPLEVSPNGNTVGYAAGRDGGVYDISALQLELSENDTATIDGLVNDAATDAPIENATVTATYQGSLVATDTTDSNGNYDLSGLTQGYDYTITANATGYNPSSTPVEDLQRSLTIDFGLSSSTVTAYGYITDDETGEYIENATVTIGTQSVQTGSITGTPNGYYAIDVKLGEYDMTVEADGYQTYTDTLSVDGETRRDVALASTTNPIYGTITYTETGEGIGGAVVEVVGTETGDTINSTRTNDVGEYTIPNLSDGTYDVFATYSGTTKAYTLTLNGSGERVDFQFDKDEYALTGTVRDARDAQQTLAGVSVTVFADDGQTVIESLTTNSNGEYNTTLAPGDYRVLFELDEYRSVRRNVTIADQPQTLDVEMIQLADALTLNTNPYLNHDTEQPFSVTLAYPDGSAEEVTADATVTSSNTTLITVNPTEQILIATANTNLSGTVQINATYTDEFGNQYTDSYNVTVAPLELSHFEKLPPVQRFAAWMEDSNSLSIIIATSAGAAVSLAATSFAGIAAVVLVMIAGWFGGFVTTGLMLVAILTGTMIGLNLANAVDIEMRGGK